MALKSILAAFSGDPESCSALGLALHLQRRHAAHLTGVVWHGPDAVRGRYRNFLSSNVSAMLAERDASATASVRADFAAHVAAEGDPEAASFIDLHAIADFSLAERARAYDLVVMSRHSAELSREHGAARPDAVALRCGRPVITVPKDYTGDIYAKPVVLAWDGKRAASRALGDALHLLRLEGPIFVARIGTAEEPAPEAGDDVIGLLGRHGIEARRILRPAGRKGIPHALVEICHEVGAGLLVMGAYEHSKLSEDLLGGVTKDILSLADLPVMMSH